MKPNRSPESKESVIVRSNSSEDKYNSRNHMKKLFSKLMSKDLEENLKLLKQL